MESSAGDKKVGGLQMYGRKRKGRQSGKIVKCNPGETTSKSNPGKTITSNSTTNISSHSQSSTATQKHGGMKRRRMLAEDGHHYVCILCKTDGPLLRCDTCSRTYHIHCVGLKSEPEGQWHCPKRCEEDYHLISYKSTKDRSKK